MESPDLTSASTQLPGTLYTFGYGKLPGAPALAELIGDERIDIVLDVRYMPTGRNPLWRPGLVANTTQKAGIPEYRWLKGLGNPDFKSGNPATKVENKEDGMNVLIPLLLAGKNVALMCVCRDTPHCHRRLVVGYAREEIPGLKVVELEAGLPPQRS